jgi:ABC-type molybdenum transport system ATPase subunit/photorepair protein PhrA
MSEKFEGLPVHGYRPQSASAVELVNDNKLLEELVLQRLDHLDSLSVGERRWMVIARSHIEQGFMALNRAIFQPERVK